MNYAKLKKWMLIISFLVSTILYQLAVAVPDSATESQIKNNVSSQQQSALELLEQLVNINSGTLNTAGVHQVGEILRAQFNQLGFKTYWAEEPANLHRSGTLIAEHLGGQGPHILLIGHLDTVFAKNDSFQKFVRHGEQASGPGVIDDKGGDIVILYALKALQSAHALNNANITVALMGDEEDSGKPTTISRKPLQEIAKKSDIALEFEWSFGLESATVARRGIAGWTIETHGTEAHSSELFQPSVGDGAIFELNRILNTMRTELLTEKYLSFNPGIILGGNMVQIDKMNQASVTGLENQVAKIAIAKGDYRFISNEQKQRFEKNVSDIVAQHLPGTSATVIFQDGIPSMPPTANNLALLKKYSQVSIDLGYGPVTALDPQLRGGSDLSHVASLVASNLGGLGPYGTGAHSNQETLVISSLPIATQRAAVLIYRLTNS
jgi:glutamate carboxypeptidase